MYCFTLVKKGTIHADGKKVVPKDEFSSLLTAKELIDEAKKEAEEKIQEALGECDSIRQKAAEEGFQEGLEKFNEHILQFNETVKHLRHEMQKAVLPLVLKSTKRILGEAIELDPQLVVDIVLQSIKGVSQMHNVKLYVSKEDLEILEQSKDKIKSVFEHLESFTLEASPDVPKGGCMIETEKGMLNATLENQFRALERAFEMHKKS